jgi:hypothetical protein
MERSNKKYHVAFAGVFFLFLLNSFRSEGQVTIAVDTMVNPAQYLFPAFTKGRIATKVGKDINLIVNYNIVTELMVFFQKGKVYDLIDYNNVDTVFLNGAIFVPGGKYYLEIKVNGPSSLLIRHKGVIKDPPKPAAYGGTSELSSSTYISNIQLGNDVYRLKAEAELVIKPADEFLIRQGEVMTVVRNEKQFTALFPDIMKELKSYLKQNKVHFDDSSEVAALVLFCNGLRN